MMEINIADHRNLITNGSVIFQEKDYTVEIGFRNLKYYFLFQHVGEEVFPVYYHGTKPGDWTFPGLYGEGRKALIHVNQTELDDMVNQALGEVLMRMVDKKLVRS